MPKWWRSRLIALCGSLLAFLTVLLPGVASSSARPTDIAIERLCVLRDAPGMTVQRALAQLGRFDCTTRPHDFGPGDFWVASAAIRPADIPRHHLRVRFGSLWQDSATLHAVYADGGIRSYSMDAYQASRHVQLGAVFEQALGEHDGAPVRLLWHIRGSANIRNIVVDARLMTEAASAARDLKLAAIYAAFAGLCVALLVHNLALWGALGYRFQLAYCAMVACLLAYMFSASGLMAWTFPAMNNNHRITMNYLTLGLSASAIIAFARTFFEKHIFTGWLRRLAIFASVMLAAAGIGFALLAPFSPTLADRIFSILFLCLPMAIVPMMWCAWRLRAQHLWLFAVAWTMPLGFAVLRLLANLHIVPASMWLENSTILVMTAEALLSAVAIAYRIRTLSLERDAAVAGETIARQLADIDPLTGLLNRRSFLDRAIGRPGEQTLLIADLDHFKQVNDTLGHDGGDEVLRIFARTLRTAVPEGALVARIGGEEFAILCDAAAMIDAEAILTRLRHTRMPFDLAVTASMGACTGVLASESDWKQLYRCADRALFDAKLAGRDRSRRTMVHPIAA